MRRLRCFLFAAVLVLSTVTLALGGDIQGPGKNDPTPTPTPTALTRASKSDAIQPTSTEQNQIVWQDAPSMLVEILFTIF